MNSIFVESYSLFLRNVGPDPLGVVPPESVTRLEAMGEWLAINGESVYGTSNFSS